MFKYAIWSAGLANLALGNFAVAGLCLGAATAMMVADSLHGSDEE